MNSISLTALLALLVPVQSGAPELAWTDALQLTLEGCGWSELGAPFDRLPAAAEELVGEPIWGLSRQSAGLAVRFRTNAPAVHARWTVTSEELAMAHMPATGVSGLDLYVATADDEWRWLGVGMPSGLSSTQELAAQLPVAEREYMLYLPLYNGVAALEIGVPAGHTVTPAPARTRPPIVFYGTSITQGACASRAGMAHVAQLGRRLGRETINLGFSGSGRLDLPVAHLLGEIDAATYVVDCLPNLTAPEIAERLPVFVRALRAARPFTPILLVEDRSYADAFLSEGPAERNRTSRAALRAGFDELLAAGVSELYYLAGAGLLGTDGEATVDSSHPTDLGFVRMADALEPVLTPLLERVAPPRAYGPVPTERQLAWHELEYYAFVHFNMNTFTNVEWGEGQEQPETFNPTALDCRQWARVAKDAGMKGIILTAKHHDGFCLWPSEFTEHDVASSPWREGRGDVLAELAEACEGFGLKFGVYLSPWDRNNPLYGDSPAYNEYFKNQLREVLTGYGDVFEVWFDGACGEGPNGKRQEYDWPGFIEVVRTHQPRAVIFSDAGPDVRWVGNERGYADEENWALLRRAEFEPGTDRMAELPRGHKDGTHWLPAECDTSIRPSWYYHPEEDNQVKSVEELLDTYYGSVGRNASLLLNLPVDRRGLVHENDAARLMELRAALDATFAENLALGATATASDVRGASERFEASNTIDADPGTYWATNDGVLTASLTLEFEAPRLFNRVLVQEFIALGQRVEKFSVEARVADVWRPVCAGTTIGYKRILRTEAFEADAVRFVIEAAGASPTIANFGLFLAPPTVHVEAPALAFLDSTRVALVADLPRAEIRYTLDGTLPSRASTLYEGPFELSDSSLLSAVAFYGKRESIVPAAASFERFERSALQPATVLEAELGQGVSFASFHGEWQSLDECRWSNPENSGVSPGFDIALRTRDTNVAMVFQSYLRVPREGVWGFKTRSDDGSRIYLDGTLVVENDGFHGLRPASGQVPLAPGLHLIEVQWFQGGGGLGLEVEWAPPGGGFEPIPAAALRN